jgi:hypothetical protein
VRAFELWRHKDETGISGTGIVAEGVQFGDGSCVLRWTAAVRSTVFYDSLADVEKIHGHVGKTEVVWTSDLFSRGRIDCVQDRCENCPFASVGGLEQRSSMSAPKYIAPGDAAEYLRGYRAGALLVFGADWETCEFGWGPALTIGGAP